jgi:hypothetical protein
MSEERHPIHLFLNEEEVALINSLFIERINRNNGLIQKAIVYPNESEVKQTMLIEKLENTNYTITNLMAELSEQAAW